MNNVGFIGLGIMGRPMAANLMKGGHTLYLYSRSGVAPELTAVGGKACATAKEVAQQAEIIITMVPDTPDVENVLFGKDGVAEGLLAGKIVVDMSSISPSASARPAQSTWTPRCPAATWAPRTRRSPSWSAATKPCSPRSSRCSS